MTNCKFLHAADIHLDSPLAKVRQRDARTHELLQRASRKSLELIVQTAIEQQVAAVVIAGDLFDGPVKDVGAGLWVDSQFRKLMRENIRTILIRGNHDALSNACQVVEWSEGLHELGAERPETIVVEEHGLAFHGQSFGARAETKDLAARYPAARNDCFNVGILHTSLSGTSQHDTYAPTSIETLEGKNYGYWALGHIHLRSLDSLSQRCYVGFSGNSQGRHIREAGPKGCQVVDVVDGQIKSVDFFPTDSVRWYEVEIEMADVETLAEIADAVEAKTARIFEGAGGRVLALRIVLTGATALHSHLTRPKVVDELSTTLADRLTEIGQIWLESVKVATSPAISKTPADLDVPLGYVDQVAIDLMKPGVDRNELDAVVEELFKKAGAELSEVSWPLLDDDLRSPELDRMLQMAKHLLESRLVSGASSLTDE